MLTKEMIQAIKQVNVSKDAELTKQRVRDLWKSTPLQKKQPLLDYGFSESSVTRAKNKGNMSVKLAAVLALLTGIDPYYLTAEADDISIAGNEERIERFIVEHGYGAVLDIKPTAQNKGKRGRKDKVNTDVNEAEQEPAVEEIVVIEEPYVEAPPISESLSIREFAELQLGLLSDAELKALGEMPEEDVQNLINSLSMKAKYSVNAINLVRLIRLILVEG